MFRRKQGVVQNKIVARHMQYFFETLEHEYRSDPEVVAKAYGKLLWGDARTRGLINEKKLSRSRFYVGLSIGDDFDELTKRVALISDTLLISHDWAGKYYELDVQDIDPTRPPDGHLISFSHGGSVEMHREWGRKQDEQTSQYNRTTTYGMHCPDLAELGRWLLETEPLLKAGLAWYLPSYSFSTSETEHGVRGPWSKLEQVEAIDYLIRDGRAVDASGAEPIKSQLVRPILRIDLPFIEGVNLRDFSKITIEEFAAYSAFRDFLRLSFLKMDMALNAVQSDRELLKLSLEIKDQVRSARSEMETVRRKRAVGVTGAVIGSVAASLVAVYGPALEFAIAALGATGGVWGIIHAATENSTRALHEDKWYYVWALAEKSNIHVI